MWILNFNWLWMLNFYWLWFFNIYRFFYSFFLKLNRKQFWVIRNFFDL